MNKIEFASPAAKRARAPGRPPKSSALGADKRAAILDAGELLFADHGFYGVSVREVAKHAGVDVALLYYYFTTKRDLFDAVFERRAAILNQARMESIDAYEAGTPLAQLTVEGTLDAFLRPTLNQAATDDPGWRAYFALVAQVNNTPIWGGQTMARYFDPVIQRLIALLRKVMPDVDEADLYWCYNFLSGSLTLAFSVTGRIDILSNGVCRSSDFTSIQDRLAKYAAAGFIEVCNRRRQSPVAP
jgi:AcrR family transcriptional regulator